MSFLSIDYDRAIQQAKKLDEAAEMCKTALNDLKKERNNSEAIWAGESGDAMRMQALAAEKELNTIQKQLSGIAASIRTVAAELKKKDEELRNIIKGFH